MKKIFYLFAFAALAFTSCKKQAEQQNAEDSSADTELNADSDVETGATKPSDNAFIDFECEYEGKVQKLSDYVGKGKYMLVDFWASWCGPCRHEIPNIIAVYNKYKGDNFDVLGVATWDKPEDTKAAIEEDNIPYQQMLNAQEAGSNAYGIEGIPEIILFAPDGTILARGLRGDDIEAAVDKYVK